MTKDRKNRVTAANETRVVLYRYRLLSIEQLSIITNYAINTLYSLLATMKKDGEIDTVTIPERGSKKAYYLTEHGTEIAANMVKEVFRKSYWQEPTGQINHSLKANQFFCNLIKQSKSQEGGLVEWLGARAAGEAYATRVLKVKEEESLEISKGVRELIPDGRGIYVFPDKTRLLINLEHDTGTETEPRLQEKIRKYLQRLPEIFGSMAEKSNVLFVCETRSRPSRLMQLVKHQAELLSLSGKVNFFSTYEDYLAGDVWKGVWLTENGQYISLKDMPRFPPRDIDYGAEEFLGKQQRQIPQMLKNKNLNKVTEKREHSEQTDIQSNQSKNGETNHSRSSWFSWG